jgi:hypothetical protein
MHFLATAKRKVTWAKCHQSAVGTQSRAGIPVSQPCDAPSGWTGYVEGPFGRCGRSFDGCVEDEALKGAQIPKPTAGNDDTAIVVTTFCWTAVRSRPRRPPIQETDPPFARWWDHDPSPIALSHGNGDFGQRAWRDHVELPDSAPSSFPLVLAAGFLRASSEAVDLAMIALPTDKNLRAAATTLARQSRWESQIVALQTTQKQSARHFISTARHINPPAQPQFLAASSPEPIERAAVLGPIKAKALRVAAKTTRRRGQP